MWLYHVNSWVGWSLRLYWRLRLEGAVDRIPRRGPLIVASNHSSFMDPWFILFMFPRPIRFLITWKWYYRSRMSQTIFRWMGTIPVRAKDPGATLEALRDLLDRGTVIGIFPEGRISQDGRVQRFRGGVAHLAALSGIPVMPIGVRGGFESLPRTRRWPRPSRVTVRVGEPMVFPGAPHAVLPPNAETRLFLTELREEVLRLSGRKSALDLLGSPENPESPEG